MGRQRYAGAFFPPYVGTVHRRAAVRHFPNPPAAAYHRNPGRPPRRGARPVRPGSGESPCGRRHPDPRYGTTGQRLCRRCGGDRMQLCPRYAAPAPVMVQRRSRKCGEPRTFPPRRILRNGDQERVAAACRRIPRRGFPAKNIMTCAG